MKHLLRSDMEISDATFNMDTNIIEFRIESFNPIQLQAFDLTVSELGWCAISKLDNSRVFVRPADEAFINAEIIMMAYFDFNESLLVTIMSY